MSILQKSHEQRVKEQINQYKNVDNMHDQLSTMFHYWQKSYFKPRFTEVTKANNHIEFYWKPFLSRIKRADCTNLLSFGTGDAGVEVEVARGLVNNGISNFRFDCVELSQAQIERAARKIKDAGLEQNFSLIEGDFNNWVPKDTYIGIMAHHALHHVQELEYLFGVIKSHLHPKGVFASIDVIGRKGHMRWPEALEIIERIWRFLPSEKKYHHILKRIDESYVNWDCSTEGFEGIRAQDILPLLQEEFCFESFFAFGNLIDVFTSRGYGSNFSVESENDIAFIDFVQYLNDLLIDLGYIKPTRMCAVMCLESIEPSVYKHWTPQFCVRKTE